MTCVICTGITLFALVLNLNCTALSQSESSDFFMCIINQRKKGVECGLQSYECLTKSDDYLTGTVGFINHETTE